MKVCIDTKNPSPVISRGDLLRPTREAGQLLLVTKVCSRHNRQGMYRLANIETGAAISLFASTVASFAIVTDDYCITKVDK